MKSKYMYVMLNPTLFNHKMFFGPYSSGHLALSHLGLAFGVLSRPVSCDLVMFLDF